jgi:very-short-patch-repair endonuclease
MNVIINAKAKQEKLELARYFRKNMTHAETILWKNLKGNKLNGLHFRRQQVILGFIVDFYCHKLSLIVEIDGEIHEEQKEQDFERERILTENGFRIVRFSNNEIENELSRVLDKIRGMQ